MLSALLVLPHCGCNRSGNIQSHVDRGQKALEAGQHVEAELAARRALGLDPSSSKALLLAGDAAAGQGRYEKAVQYYKQIPTTQVRDKVIGHNSSALHLIMELHQLGDAEQQFRESLKLSPGNTTALDGLAHLLSITGRRWESARHYLELIRTDDFNVGHLYAIADLEVILAESDRLDKCRWAAPRDALPLLGLARLELLANRTRESKGLLLRAVDLDSQLIEAQARLGHLLLDAQDDVALRRWNESLPADSGDHPEIWVVRGRWAHQLGDLRGAVRCYVEALRRDANHPFAAYQVSVLLDQLDAHELAKSFAHRAQQLLEFRELIQKLHADPENARLMQLIVESTEELGRLWECRGWCKQILLTRKGEASVQKTYGRLSVELKPDTPQTVNSANPAFAVDLSSWPVPHFTAGMEIVGTAPPRSSQPASVQFAELAAQSGLRFQYFNGHDAPRADTRLYEVDGGGVGILDYDADGWPDIYLTQGSHWPPAVDQTEYLDKLFRNLGNGRFEDVTERAGLHENGFSQGVAIGDFDNDGFPDIYVANIGENRLFHNLGDGTFKDVTATAGISGSVWTSSCMIADLNGDAFPDIYEVNYLKGPRIFDRVCHDARGTPRICPPLMFDAERDKHYVNQGDGSFVEGGAEAGVQVEDGRGLGIIAADFTDSGKLDVFVANDVLENFYFENNTPKRGDPVRMAENGVLLGVALDGNGLGQACMGVAADDVNLDGRLDFFVTNFHGESNTLYVQQPGAYFVDDTRRANLRDASFPMLGFGTEFLDGELDGLPDLVVTNGHLVDESDLGVPYRMRPQYFRNLGDGRFEELPRLGSFFSQQLLGRGLATTDWNRDGREDFVVTHLYSPAALVTNVTSDAGHFLAVHLRGVQSDRDAIGTNVTVVAGGNSRRRQLVGGSGYQVTNQRLLIFGLAESENVDELVVQWPSGLEQSWTNLNADVELLLIEGCDAPVVLPR